MRTVLPSLVPFVVVLQACSGGGGSGPASFTATLISPADNAAPFGSSVSTLPRTTTAVQWSPADWPTVGEQGPDQRTSNIAAVIQEIIGRPGWQEGNALVLIITGSGKRTAESTNGGGNGTPLLHVEYQVGPPDALAR